MRDEKFDYLFIEESRYGGVSVKGVGTWGRGSVLEGQSKIVFLDSFDTYEEACEAYPEAQAMHAMMQPQNTYDHLSDGGDY